MEVKVLSKRFFALVGPYGYGKFSYIDLEYERNSNLDNNACVTSFKFQP